MNPEQHRDVAARVLGGLGKLSLEDLYRPAIEAAVLAGYHLANAALHESGVSPDCTHVNIPSRSSVASDDLPPAAQKAWDAFRALERLRWRYVRSFTPYDREVAVVLRRALDELALAQPNGPRRSAD